MSYIKRHLDDIMDLYWNGYTKEEIVKKLNTTKELVEGGIAMAYACDSYLHNGL